MQDRRQLCFVLALVGGIFAIGSGVMMLLMSAVVFGAVAMPMPDAQVPGIIFALFGWLAVMSVGGGIVTIVGALRLRNAVGPALRAAATWTIVGGCIAVLGGNVLAAGLAIAGGAIQLSEPT